MIRINEEDFRLDLIIFDILGQHDFRNLRRMYVDGADGIMLVVDVSKTDTIESIESFWCPEIERIVGKIPTVVMGNKTDLCAPDAEGVSLLRMVSGILLCTVKLCSAKSGDGVEESFMQLANEIIERHIERERAKRSGDKIENLKMAADAIITHFCEQQENKEVAIETCESLFRDADFVPEKPTKDSLIAAIDLLEEQDKTLFGDSIAKKNKDERLKFVANV